MKTLYCMGEMLVDMIDVEHRGLNEASLYQRVPGGACANVAIGAARLKTPVYFMGTLGSDTFGEMLHQVLSADHVNTDYVVHEGATTIAWVGLNPEGERRFEFMRGSDGDYQVSDALLAKLNEQAIVHFGSATAFLGNELEQSYHRLLQRAVEVGAFITFDPNYRPTLIRDVAAFKQKCLPFMANANVLKLSEEELMLLMPASSLRESIAQLRAHTQATICITMGAAGTLLVEGEVLTQIPSVRIEQVDTTGAGDAFMGALLSQVAKGESDYQTMVAYANKAGAITASRIGAISSLPSQQEIEDF